MNILLDTNIVIAIIRANNFDRFINYINPENSSIYLSIVSVAEVQSIAIRKKWGERRLNFFNTLLDRINIIDINQSYINIYAEIDTYSQRLNPSFDKYSFDTPRNMGKNDLWIASLAALLGLKLITTDSDFSHLNNVFFEVKNITSKDLMEFVN